MDHTYYMHKALILAEKGGRAVAPNPMVGSVIVHNGVIIGEGYHEKFGGPHAEVNAVASVKDRSLLPKSTIYVTLEPCCHYGKTPPCTELILKEKIPEVVIAIQDPFPKVAGGGASILKSHGVKVISGVLEAEATRLNHRFLTLHTKKRPWIILKWAETADRYIAKEDYSSKWISSEKSRELVHKWRSEEQAILVGFMTASKDNPELTVRYVKGINPLRIVVDERGELPKSLKLFDGNVETLIVTGNDKVVESQNIRVAKIDSRNNIAEEISRVLYERNIVSVIIEGGSRTIQRFIDSGLWDEARIFVSKEVFGKGISAPTLKVEPFRTEVVGSDTLKFVHNLDR